MARFQSGGEAVIEEHPVREEKPSPEQQQLAQRLYVALVEERNLMAQQYGEFPYEPVKPMDAWKLLEDVAKQVAW